MPCSFDRTFPSDVADDFDVFIGGAPTGNPKIQMFMPGHMTIFRNDPRVARAFFALEEIASYGNFMSMPWISEPSEEGEHSHTLFMRTDLTFLRFDAIVDSPHHLSTLDGVYTIEHSDWMANSAVYGPEPPTPEVAFTLPAARQQISGLLARRNRTARRGRTFSATGMEREIVLRDDAAASEGMHMWFPQRYAVVYLSELSEELKDGGRGWRRYVAFLCVLSLF
jgi:hypothetical protein